MLKQDKSNLPGIYLSASAVVRAKMPGDESEATSKPLDVRRGVVQGDIFSPVFFYIRYMDLFAQCKLIKQP